MPDGSGKERKIPERKEVFPSPDHFLPPWGWIYQKLGSVLFGRRRRRGWWRCRVLRRGCRLWGGGCKVSVNVMLGDLQNDRQRYVWAMLWVLLALKAFTP